MQIGQALKAQPRRVRFVQTGSEKPSILVLPMTKHGAIKASLDFSLAMEVTEYFQLKSKDAESIKQQVVAAVSRRGKVAEEVGLSRGQRELMRFAFNV